jgi:glycosyltransferase involved in cell wall biosynthesis
LNDVERVGESERLRIAVLSDFDGPHARSWLRWFIARGHDLHAVSFYPPREPVSGATMHALRPRAASSGAAQTTEAGGGIVETLRAHTPRGLLRLAHAARYQQAGLRGLLQRIRPDVFQAHYVVEHGFYGALARVRPLVVTAWGSDVLVDPQADPISRLIARWTIGRADLVTSNNAYMARRIGALGALPSRVAVITLGAERYDLELADHSVNRRDDASSPTIISTRAHEPLYNIDTIIDAYSIVREMCTDARLVIANGGSQTAALHSHARGIDGVTFAGVLERADFRNALAAAQVFVSVPSSDATSVALLQAMAAGAFPIVSALPSQRELIADGVNGYVVPVRDVQATVAAISRALADPLLRRTAAEQNRRLVEERGLNETQMAKLEAHFYHLAGKRAPA